MEPTEGATESALLKRIDHGLEIAVREAGLRWEDERNRVKREKYQFFAVRDHCGEEFPVTYSWYRYGISAIAPNIDSPLQTDNDNEIFFMDEDEFANYFLDEEYQMPLSEWWLDDVSVLDFLEEFYDLECPPELRELYLANVKIRKILENRILHRITEGADTIPNEDYFDLQRELLTVQTALASDQGEDVFDDEVCLADLYDAFIEYSDLLEDAVLVIVNRDGLSGDEYTPLVKLKNVFDSTMWPYITIIISARTAIGPNADRVEPISERKFEQLSNDLESELQTAEYLCKENDLVASLSDYEKVGGEGVESTVNELMDVIDGNRT